MAGLEAVYVYCSNPVIQQYIPKDVRYLPRSASLDQDTTKMNEALQHFAFEVAADIYVMTHTTAPFISARPIMTSLAAVQSGEYDFAFAVKRIQDFLCLPIEDYEKHFARRMADVLMEARLGNSFEIDILRMMRKRGEQIPLCFYALCPLFFSKNLSACIFGRSGVQGASSAAFIWTGCFTAAPRNALHRA